MVLWSFLFAFMFGSGAALAHYVYDNANVWEITANGECLHAWVEISDGNVTGGDIAGYTKVDLRAANELDAPPHPACTTDAYHAVGQLRARNILKKCSLSGDVDCNINASWGACLTTPWKFNDVRDADMRDEKFWNVDCGNGWYANFGGGHRWYDSMWKGGYLFSGAHQLVKLCSILCVRP